MDFKNWFKFKKKEEGIKVKPVEEKEDVGTGFFTTDIPPELPTRKTVVERALKRTFVNGPEQFRTATNNMAMDSSVGASKPSFGGSLQNIPDAQVDWYGSQGFIGYQFCAMLAQHWLIHKCCYLPAEDAVRNLFEITVNDGTEVNTDILDEIKKSSVRYKLTENLRQFVHFGRVFGIRIALFVVESDDPDYYFKPFNPDGITPNSYKGISQVDPYWMTPELDSEAASNPAAIDFYEPTWWRVNATRIHRSHLVIMRNSEVADILKPTYIYGGVSVPQKIYERVYSSERTANEAPQLALTKRTTLIHVDTTQALAKQASFEQRLSLWSRFWTNFGIKVLGEKETAEQFDTSLADLDAVIMTQFQLVAAAANVPATKLLGTSPKGFNATGEYEERSYHEELKNIQTHHLTPLVERHLLLVLRSEICPKFNIQPFSFDVRWNPLALSTPKELAELNKTKAETGATLINSGSITPDQERQRIIQDPDSGYNGINDTALENEPEEIYNAEEIE